MTTQLKPETAALITAAAERLGITGPDAPDQVVRLALEGLEAKTAAPSTKLTTEEIEAEYQALSAAGRRWREEHPDQYDERNPPSKTWQDELYDEHGLPA